MNWLPLILVALFLKNFTPRSRGTGSENLLSLLKAAASLKSSGVFDLLRSEHPLSALLSGEFPLENLLGALSAFSRNEGKEGNAPCPAKSPLSEELTGEEMGEVLRRFLDERDAVNF